MYAGRVVEQAGVHELFARPAAPLHRRPARGASPQPGRHAGTDRLQEIPGLVPVLSEPARRVHVRRPLPALETVQLAAAAARTVEAGAPVSAPPPSLACCGPAPAEPGTSIASSRAHSASLRRDQSRPPTGPETSVFSSCEDLVMHFGAGAGRRRRVPQIRRGEVTALVGESGSGKSTVGRCIVRLVEPTGGTVLLADADVTHLSRAGRCARTAATSRSSSRTRPPRWTRACWSGDRGRADAPPAPGRQAVPQGAGSSAWPQSSSGSGCGLRSPGATPHELSGGQRQRVEHRPGADRPSRSCSSPTSRPVALDVSVQASVLNLLADLQRDLGFACLFITHDLSAVEYLADDDRRDVPRPAGRTGHPRARSSPRPRHPYTQALLAAAPGRRPGAQRDAPARAARRRPARPPSTRRPAAGSTPAARSPSTSCADGGAGAAGSPRRHRGRLPPREPRTGRARHPRHGLLRHARPSPPHATDREPA